MKFTVEIKRLLKDARKATKAFCDVVIDDSIVIHDVSVVDGKNGLFVAMPSKKVGESYKDIAHPLSTECRKAISDAIFEKYNEELNA